MVAVVSLHSVVNSVGSYAGLASVLGLALLALLYFAQARELRRMSDWIEQEEERRRGVPVASAGAPAMAALRPPPVVGATATAPVVAAGTGSVTTAVPGVRRVAVPAAAATPAAAMPAATAAAQAAPPPAVPAALEGTSPQPAAGSPERPNGLAVPVAAPPAPAEDERAGAAAAKVEEPPASPPGDAPGAPEAGDPWARPEGLDSAAAAVPRPPSGDPAAGNAADEGSITVVVPRPRPPSGDTAAGEAPEDPGGDTTVVRPSGAPAAAVPLVAARVPSAEPRRGVVPPEHAAPGAAEPGAAEEPPAPRVEEPAPLAPSTPAGARPRLPPAPSAPVASAPAAAVRPATPAPVTIRPLVVPATPETRVVAEPTRRRVNEPPPLERRERPTRSWWGTVRFILTAIVIVAILIFVATRLFNGSSGKPGATHTSNSSTLGAAPAPSTITVAVLNGTRTTHLASDGWTVLGNLGFRQGAIADAPSQRHSRSIVGYTAGERPAAIEVAQGLTIALSHVAPVDAASLAAAVKAGRTPQVVVTLGRDYAQSR